MYDMHMILQSEQWKSCTMTCSNGSGSSVTVSILPCFLVTSRRSDSSSTHTYVHTHEYDTVHPHPHPHPHTPTHTHTRVMCVANGLLNFKCSYTIIGFLVKKRINALENSNHLEAPKLTMHIKPWITTELPLNVS